MANCVKVSVTVTDCRWSWNGSRAGRRFGPIREMKAPA
jgi:hypothetical protein